MTTGAVAEQSVALRQIATEAPLYTSYEPLDADQREIRVLDLEANLTCTLRHVSLTSEPVYSALSYYWGAPGSTEMLTIKPIGPKEAEIVSIRATLAKFLRSLYQQCGPITVWLDAICINQRSVTEQSAQVAMMGDIYKQAECVYAWMGPWDPDIEHCFRYAVAASTEQAADFDITKVASCLETRFFAHTGPGMSAFAPRRALNLTQPAQSLDCPGVCTQCQTHSGVWIVLRWLGSAQDHCESPDAD